jgi:hypothetical protein
MTEGAGDAVEAFDGVVQVSHAIVWVLVMGRMVVHHIVIEALMRRRKTNTTKWRCSPMMMRMVLVMRDGTVSDATTGTDLMLIFACPMRALHL